MQFPYDLDNINTVNSPYSEHNLQQYFVHYMERFTIERDNSYEPPLERFTKNVHYMEMFTMESWLYYV